MFGNGKIPVAFFLRANQVILANIPITCMYYVKHVYHGDLNVFVLRVNQWYKLLSLAKVSLTHISVVAVSCFL